jgi:DNA-binding protein YbaB
MFDKLKELGKIKKLQKSIENEEFEAEKEGVKVVINGSFMVKNITLNPALENNKQENVLKECLNDAFKKARLAVAKKFSQII